MVFGKLVSGSEKNEQTRQVADIRSRVLKEECGLKIEAEPEAFACMPLAYEGDTPVRPEKLLLTVKVTGSRKWQCCRSFDGKNMAILLCGC